MENQDQLKSLQSPSPVSAAGKCASQSFCVIFLSLLLKFKPNPMVTRGRGKTQNDLRGAVCEPTGESLTGLAGSGCVSANLATMQAYSLDA